MTSDKRLRLTLANLDEVEKDLRSMNISRIYTSMNLASGSIVIDVLELCDENGRNPVRLTVDKDGNLRIYPTLELDETKPMTVYNWGIHRDNKKE